MIYSRAVFNTSKMKLYLDPKCAIWKVRRMEKLFIVIIVAYKIVLINLLFHPLSFTIFTIGTAKRSSEVKGLKVQNLVKKTQWQAGNKVNEVKARGFHLCSRNGNEIVSMEIECTPRSCYPRTWEKTVLNLFLFEIRIDAVFAQCLKKMTRVHNM